MEAACGNGYALCISQGLTRGDDDDDDDDERLQWCLYKLLGIMCGMMM